MYVPAPATSKDMCRFHSYDYIDFLNRVTPSNSSEFQQFFQQYNVMEDWYIIFKEYSNKKKFNYFLKVQYLTDYLIFALNILVEV